MKKINIYFDMDGVLAKWNPDASEEETHEKGYFANREADDPVVELVKMFITLPKFVETNGVNVFALSAVYEDDHSSKEKDEWLMKVGLDKITRLFVPYGQNKSEFIESDEEVINVLVDDYGKNLREWGKAGKNFIPVKYYNGINNLPKLNVKNDIVNISLDTWDGYSINNKMTVETMFKVLYSLIRLYSEEAA